MARPSDERCRNCQWHHLKDCRRYPPVIIDPYTKEGGFPKTVANAWCGEFKPAKPKEVLPPVDKRGTWAGSPAISDEWFD